VTRRPRARRPRRLAPRRRTSFALFAVVVALLAALGGFLLVGPGPPAASGASTDIVLPPGAGLPGIADALAHAGVIRSRTAFIAAAELTGAARALKAGEYDVPSRASLAWILSAVRRGAVVRHMVTIPEGATSQAALEILMRAPFLSGQALAPPEGSILPETYEARRGEPRQELFVRMRTARDALLTTLWASRSPNLPYKIPEDAVILASVVEKETAKPEERPRIAEVFINRLRKGMRLESDPTVIYGLNGGEPLGHGLRVSEIASRTPYNTYLVSGLPPTPIANPGRAALMAALSPASGDELYFVAEGTGGHAFASTFDAHMKNVAHWRAVEKKNSKETTG
jgi:UPF0755 protein